MGGIGQGGPNTSTCNPGSDETSRLHYAKNALQLTGRGDSPADSSPLTCGVADRAYQVEVTLRLLDDAEGGLLLFYNHKAFVGVGFTPAFIKTFQYAEEQAWARQYIKAKEVRVRLTNDHHVVTFEYSHDGGRNWKLHPTRMEVSGLNHNVFGGFLSLKVGLYSVGNGSIQLRDFTYRALEQSA